ncbi:hypothetical protein [Treponema sp.]|uniref:hypothetical protein n=1 Tax=Treponema sp. TaxID=166 RepID=UPI00298EBE3E|nr:hypothetical protein [Treponema sp.]MCQ2240075.1 hypothetical protein [Treponema sp.]
MKKSSPLSKITAIILTVLFLDSCENFMNGNELKSEIDNNILDANTERVEVSIFAMSSYGTLTGETGGTYKIGTTGRKLEFSENENYQFVGWKVSDAEGKEVGCTKTDLIHISNPNSKSTTFSVLGTARNFRIEAVCAPRPKVTLISPFYITSGINFDSDIEVYFSQSVSKDNFEFSQEEISAYGEFAQSTDNGTILIAGEKYFKNIQITDSNGTNLSTYYKNPVLSSDGKKLTLSYDKSKIYDFSSNPVKDIFVSVSSDIYCEYGMGDGTKAKIYAAKENLEHNFRIGNETTEKSSFTLSSLCNGVSVGQFSEEGLKTLNLGQAISVDFAPASKYEFISWNIQGNDNNELEITENGTNLLIVVKKAVSGVVISPICQREISSKVYITGKNSTISPLAAVVPLEIYPGEKIVLNANYDSSLYSFAGWHVWNKTLGYIISDEEVDEYFSCNDWTNPNTEVTLKKPCPEFEITGNSYPRPHIITHYPIYERANRDQAITVSFDQNISEETFYYSEKEMEDLKYEYRDCKSVDFLSDEKGCYSFKYVKMVDVYGNTETNYLYRNLTITERGGVKSNYSKYYDRPYLSDSKTLVIPAKIVADSEGKLIIGDLPPANADVFIQVGSGYGYYAEGTFIPLVYDSGCSWVYSTNDQVDGTKPEFTSNSTSIYRKTSTNKNSLRSSRANVDYFQALTENNDGLFVVKGEVKDAGSNLLKVSLQYERIEDQYQNVLTNPESGKINVDFENRESSGSFNTVLDLTVLKDGLYKIWLEAEDSANNKVVYPTAYDKCYYFYLDRTPPAPVDLSNIKIYQRYKHVKIDGQWTATKLSTDYDAYLYFNDISKENVTNFTGAKILEFSGSGKYSIRQRDKAGNQTITWIDYELEEEVPGYSYLYKDGWFSKNDYEGKDSYARSVKSIENKTYLINKEELDSYAIPDSYKTIPEGLKDFICDWYLLTDENGRHYYLDCLNNYFGGNDSAQTVWANRLYKASYYYYSPDMFYYNGNPSSTDDKNRYSDWAFQNLGIKARIYSEYVDKDYN